MQPQRPTLPTAWQEPIIRAGAPNEVVDDWGRAIYFTTLDFLFSIDNSYPDFDNYTFDTVDAMVNGYPLDFINQNPNQIIQGGIRFGGNLIYQGMGLYSGWTCGLELLSLKTTPQQNLDITFSLKAKHKTTGEVTIFDNYNIQIKYDLTAKSINNKTLPNEIGSIIEPKIQAIAPSIIQTEVQKELPQIKTDIKNDIEVGINDKITNAKTEVKNEVDLSVNTKLANKADKTETITLDDKKLNKDDFETFRNEQDDEWVTVKGKVEKIEKEKPSRDEVVSPNTFALLQEDIENTEYELDCKPTKKIRIAGEEFTTDQSCISKKVKKSKKDKEDDRLLMQEYDRLLSNDGEVPVFDLGAILTKEISNQTSPLSRSISDVNDRTDRNFNINNGLHAFTALNAIGLVVGGIAIYKLYKTVQTLQNTIASMNGNKETLPTQKIDVEKANNHKFQKKFNETDRVLLEPNGNEIEEKKKSTNIESFIQYCNDNKLGTLTKKINIHSVSANVALEIEEGDNKATSEISKGLKSKTKAQNTTPKKY